MFKIKSGYIPKGPFQKHRQGVYWNKSLATAARKTIKDIGGENIMRIILVGCGKIGYTTAKSLAMEKGFDVTIIDNDAEALEKAGESIDAMLIRGNGLNADILIEAGVKDADLLISMADADETNILCCVLAKYLGTKYTAARVRNPGYALELGNFWKDLGLDLIINPESEAAREISRLLRFPTVDDIDIFLGGRVELVSFKVEDTQDYFAGKSVAEVFPIRKKMKVILALVERAGRAFIPHGDLTFEKDDVLKIMGRPSNIMDFFALIGKNTNRIKSAVIIGGNKITHYLVELLHRHSSATNIKIIEIDKRRCEELSEEFPRCIVIHGDGTDEDVLTSEVVDQAEAIVCLTDRDEENTVIALYCLHLGIRKVILKINHINQDMVRDLKIGSIISPQNITAKQILRHVKGMANKISSSVKNTYEIYNSDDEKVYAIEFAATDRAKCLNLPIREMKIKRQVLIACLVRSANIIIPTGDTFFKAGDSVIIVTTDDDIREIDDILA